MSAPQRTTAFHLSYDAEEDRILLAVDVESDQRYAMALTRRIAKLVLAALADLSVKRSGRAARADPQHRDTVLNFEHTRAVAEGLASGATKTRQPKKPLVQPPRLVHEVKLSPKGDGGVLMACDDRQRVLTLDLPPARIHRLMAGVLDLATGAGWDLPLIAAWLDRAGAGDTGGAARVVH